MNKKNIILCFICFFLFLACEKEEEEEKIRPVKIEIIGESLEKTNRLQYPASLVAEKETKLSFPIAGTIENIFVEKGSFVKKGDLLASLEKEDYRINSEANEQKYLASLANAENANLQFERVKILYEKNAIAKKDFDYAKAQYKAANAAAKANQLSLSHTKKQLKDTELRAPYDGNIASKFQDAASVISAGMPILSIASDNVSEITIQVANKDLDSIREAKNFVFVPDDEEDKEYPILLKTIGNAPDSMKTTYPVTFTLDLSKVAKEFRSGTTGNVFFTIDRKEKTMITLPITALFEENGTYVYIYGEEDIVERRKIEIGALQEEGRIVIEKGLKQGDKVITAGISEIYEGEKVRLIPKETTSNVGNVL